MSGQRQGTEGMQTDPCRHCLAASSSHAFGGSVGLSPCWSQSANGTCGTRGSVPLCRTPTLKGFPSPFAPTAGIKRHSNERQFRKRNNDCR